MHKNSDEHRLFYGSVDALRCSHEKREVTYIVVVVPTNDVWKFSVTEAVKEFPDIRNNSLFLFHSLVLFVV